MYIANSQCAEPKAIRILDGQLPDPSQQWEISFDDDPDLMEELGLAEDETLEPEAEEFVTLLSDITHIITCLYRFSMATRNATPRDRLHKITSIEVSHFEFWDIAHIEHKFPMAPSYLVQRLGKANTRRRQLMKYYRGHHGTIARYINRDVPLASDSRIAERPGALKGSLGKQAQGGEEHAGGIIINAPTTIANSIVAKSQTTVSTIKQDAFHVYDVAGIGPEPDEDQVSQTSYATSANHQRIRIAPPPNPDAAYNGTPFECHYCFQIISIRDRRAWRYVIKQAGHIAIPYMHDASGADFHYYLGSMSSGTSSHISVRVKTALDPRSCTAVFMNGMGMKFSFTGENGIVISAQNLCRTEPRLRSTWSKLILR